MHKIVSPNGARYGDRRDSRERNVRILGAVGTNVELNALGKAQGDDRALPGRIDHVLAPSCQRYSKNLDEVAGGQCFQVAQAVVA